MLATAILQRAEQHEKEIAVIKEKRAKQPPPLARQMDETSEDTKTFKWGGDIVKPFKYCHSYLTIVDAYCIYNI